MLVSLAPMLPVYDDWLGFGPETFEPPADCD